MKDLSLVLPCYNEAEHIKESINRIYKTLEFSKLKFEIILVEDKSRDNTKELIKKLIASKKYKNIKAYYHKQNIGRGGTVVDGIKKSKSKVVGFIDIDLEVAPEYILPIVNKLLNGESDVVVGHRHYPLSFWPPEHFLRVILSKGYSLLVNKILYLPISDSESGYKFFIREKILPVISKTKNKHWFWDTEVLIRSYIEGLRVSEYPVLFLRRDDKTSTVNLYKDTLAYFHEITHFKKEINKETKKQQMGLLYNFPRLYTFVMKLLYRDSYDDAYKKIAKLINKNSTVVDLCSGDAKLKEYFEKSIDYMAIEGNPSFFYYLLKKHVFVKLADVEEVDIPKADYIILQRSLYQMKNPQKLVRRMLKSAKKAVIVSESIHNLKESSGSSFFKQYIPNIVATRNKDPNFRYSEDTFLKLMKSFTNEFITTQGRRDIIAIIRK